jgi:glutathione S-transferase
LDEGKIKELYELFSTIDEHYFPNGNEWIAGESVTAADFAYVGTISTLIVSTSHV